MTTPAVTFRSSPVTAAELPAGLMGRPLPTSMA
jgi:hypothetical protein